MIQSLYHEIYLNKLLKRKLRMPEYFVSESMRLIQMSLDAGDVQDQVAG
jgi:hypothetical protein